MKKLISSIVLLVIAFSLMGCNPLENKQPRYRAAEITRTNKSSLNSGVYVVDLNDSTENIDNVWMRFEKEHPDLEITDIRTTRVKDVYLMFVDKRGNK